LTAAQARKIALSFPGAYERIAQGGPEIRVGEEFLVRIGTREPDTLMLKTSSLEERDMMLEAEPKLFFITDHYKTYKGLLARLSELDAKTLRALLKSRMQAVASKKNQSPRHGRA
jgi:hypothetical protein